MLKNSALLNVTANKQEVRNCGKNIRCRQEKRENLLRNTCVSEIIFNILSPEAINGSLEVLIRRSLYSANITCNWVYIFCSESQLLQQEVSPFLVMNRSHFSGAFFTRTERYFCCIHNRQGGYKQNEFIFIIDNATVDTMKYLNSMGWEKFILHFLSKSE